MERPSYLNSRDKVYLLSTARRLDKDAFLPAVKWLESIGLEAVLGETCSAQYHQFAGDDELRIKDLQHALDNPEIKAIWCLRGGYGTVRIIDHLSFTQFNRSPKWVIGYSDITALHGKLWAEGVQSIHATMPVNIPPNPNEEQTKSMQSLKNVLFGKIEPIRWSGTDLDRPGTASGMLVGGNLSVLYSMLGSSTFPKTQGNILFLEDLDEYLYHIDRMLMAFKRAGALDGLNGLLIGGMSDMNDNTVPFGKDALTIIKEAVDEYEFPVYFHFPAGHQDLNLPLILGAPIQMADSTLVFEK